MLKRSLSIALFLAMTCFAKTSFAQANYEDVVYLKNGSIIHGVVIEQIPNQSLKIKMQDRNVFVYKIDEVEKITKEEIPSVNNTRSGINAMYKSVGYTNITEANFAFGMGENGDVSYGFQTINGYQFNPHLNTGLGVGVDFYKNVTFMPVFADVRAYLLKGQVSPYFSAAGGYAVSLSEYNKGGLMINPSFGVKVFVAPKTALNFSLGYRLQKNEINQTIPVTEQYYQGSTYNGYPMYGYRTVYHTYTMKQSMDFFNVKVGLTF